MKRTRRPWPSPATGLAALALLVALGGTGYAAVSAVLPSNSVGTKQLKNNAVISTKVKNGSLKAGDFAPGQIPAGPAGPAGPSGAAGPAGPSDSFARFANGPVSLPFGSKANVLQLSLAAGKYIVFGKAWIENTAGIGTSNVECDLTVGGDFDRGRVGLDDQNVGPAKNGTMALTVAANLGSAGSAVMTCGNFGGGLTVARFLKITAIKVADLTNSG